INVATGAMTTVFEFPAGSPPNLGSSLEAGLTNDGAGFLWGTADYGGTYGDGTLFKIKIDTGVIAKVFESNGSTGTSRVIEPAGALVRDANGLYWGTSVRGGTSDVGGVFKV